ncbi:MULTISPECIES: BON domain-containing protein [unclassified Variovorax]|jgi:osmotically-inducible protein OsmY|uniref:BON domain-containing protein n=1 Tax=unclassified Variovorax TaxID=663243 RepID=UPI002B22FD90|nr:MULTISPECIES: BON domain-containing protein [unclassified Variovorax]MEB0059431.1 BON domain-containing protein [Variovorax sp. LG9.2]MEB0114496.1 BON domain-containing protein [Variovorax sp. RTB1]
MKTDSDLQQDVIAELKWEPSVHAAEIGVSVKDGVVTLTGEVNSFPEKWIAQSAAQRVVGVQALVIALNVKLTELGKRTDADIARSAETALSWRASLPNDALKVMVEHGWITLSGEIEWQFQRQAAIDAVSHLVGVLGVNNQMTLKAKDIPSTIEQDIEAALRRVVGADARDISVAVHGADVTLTGTVNGWAARDLATRCAWGATGVRDVVDKMTLTYE